MVGLFIRVFREVLIRSFYGILEVAVFFGFVGCSDFIVIYLRRCFGRGFFLSFVVFA